MEETTDVQTSQPSQLQADSPPQSVWRSSATAAAALTLLAACGIAMDVHNPIEALGQILFTVPITFLFWWLICSFLVWLWRVMFGSRSNF